MVFNVLRLERTRWGVDSPGVSIDKRGGRTQPDSRGVTKDGPPRKTITSARATKSGRRARPCPLKHSLTLRPYLERDYQQ